MHLQAGQPQGDPAHSKQEVVTQEQDAIFWGRFGYGMLINSWKWAFKVTGVW